LNTIASSFRASSFAMRSANRPFLALHADDIDVRQ
jgi:hypothetical protein